MRRRWSLPLPLTPTLSPRAGRGRPQRLHHRDHPIHATPSFFCSEEDEVVYWNISFLPG